MKKIIALALASIMFASSTFALGLGIGGKAIIGRNVADGETVKEALASATTEKNFDFGGSAYVNLSLLGGLGAQLEANFINSSVTFSYTEDESSSPTTKKYETMLFDIAPMVWWNIDLWKLRIGLGAGPNFSITVNSPSELKTATKDMFTMGVCAGADVRFYITNGLGIVVSGRYVGEFTEKTNTVEVAGLDVADYPSYETKRQTLYGGIGAEFKLF